MKQFLIVFFISICLITKSEIPQHNPNSYVTDLAGLLTGQESSALNKRITDFKTASTIEIAIVTVPKMDGREIEEYAVDMFNQWGIGKRGLRNGLLILVAMEEKKWRIEVGRGLEGDMTDMEAGRIGNKILKPNLKSKNYYAGFNGVLDAFIEKLDPIKNEQVAAYEAQQAKENEAQTDVLIEFLIYSLAFITLGCLIGFMINNDIKRKKRIREEQEEKIRKLKEIKNGTVTHGHQFNKDMSFLKSIKDNKYGIDISNMMQDYKSKVEEINGAFEAVNCIVIDNKTTPEDEELLKRLSAKIKESLYVFSNNTEITRKKYDLCRQLEENFVLFNKVKDENEKSFEVFYEKTKIIHNQLYKSKTFKKTIDEESCKINFYNYIRHAKSIIKQAKDLLLINKDYAASFKIQEEAIYNYKKAFEIKESLEGLCKKFDNINLNLKKNISSLESLISKTKSKVSNSDVSSTTRKKFLEKKKEVETFLTNQSIYDLFTISLTIDLFVQEVNKIYKKASDEIDEEENERVRVRRRASDDLFAASTMMGSSISSFDFSSSSSDSGSFGGGDSGGGGASGSFD